MTEKKALSKYGLYVECWDYGQYMIADVNGYVGQEEAGQFSASVAADTEQCIGSKPKKGEPEALRAISDMWEQLSAGTGDAGSCVIGAGFRFRYHGQKYFLHARSHFQGSISWERHMGYIQECLEAIGAGKIQYDWGRMD